MPQYWVLNPYHAFFDQVPKITVCVNCRFKKQQSNNIIMHNIQTILLGRISG